VSHPYFQGLIVPPDCHTCPLRGSTKVFPEGPIPAKLCLVGESPGVNELVQGHAFVGQSGHLLWMLAAAYGIHREEVWLSNASLCMPREVRLQSGAVLTMSEVKTLSTHSCRRRLIGELLTVTENHPDSVIVPMGNHALRALAPQDRARDKMKIYAYRGSIMEVDLNKLWAEVHQDAWRFSVV